MIFYTCEVYQSGSKVASWSTVQSADYDGVIADLSDIRVGLGESQAVPVSSVEMKLLRSAAVDALLSDLPTAFALEYRIALNIDGVSNSIGYFYHAAELPVSDAQTTTVFLQDAVSRIGSTQTTPTLVEIMAAGDATSNPLFGVPEDFHYLRGTENTPTRIAFGKDQIDLKTPIWRKVNRDFGPGTFQFGDWMYFVSHVQALSPTSTLQNVFAFDGGAEVPLVLPTVPSGEHDMYFVTSVPVTKGGVTWYVQIVAIQPVYVAMWVFARDPNGPLGNYFPGDDISRPIVSVSYAPPTPEAISAKYTVSSDEVDAATAYFIGMLPFSATWSHASEVVSDDGAYCAYAMLLLCESIPTVDVQSFGIAQALARPIAGVATGTARDALTQICNASGISICASREGQIQFVARTNAAPTVLTDFNDVAFSWRDSGGRDAPFCAVQLLNHKLTATTAEAAGGIVYQTDSAMYLAGIRDVVLELDCSLIPRDLQQDAAAVMSYVGVKPNGEKLVRLKVPLRDVATTRIGDNIQFTYLPYVGATPETVTASLESITFSADSAELGGIIHPIDYPLYVLPGDRLQSIMPVLQAVLTGNTRGFDFQDGTTYWEYTGTHWRTHGAALSSDLGAWKVWIRYVYGSNRLILALGALEYDPTDGVIITRGPDTLEGLTTTLAGLDVYDILMSQNDALDFDTANFGGASPMLHSETFGPIENGPVCNDVGLDPLTLDALVWTFTAAAEIQATTGVTGFSTRTGYCAVIDGIGFSFNAVVATGGFVTIFFDSEPTWRVGTAGLTGIYFARISDVKTGTVVDTGALTEDDGTGSPSGPRVLA